MEKELDPEVIKLTQNALGKYVKRPPLSEKLLKKPPFRFLHDIITTVLKTTGFFDKLFDEEELVSDNVKDRDSKISFLNKVIFVISSTTGKSISVKPSKIVAGQEPEKTNELLQCLGQALDQKLSSDKAVKQYKDSLKSTQESDTKIKESKSTKKISDSKKSTSKLNEKLPSQKNNVSRTTTNKQEKEKSNDVKSKRKENNATKGEVQSQSTQQSKSVTKKNARDLKEAQKDDKTQSRIKSSTHNVIDKEKTSINPEKEKIRNNLSKLQSQNSDVSFEKVDPLGEEIAAPQENSMTIRQNDQDNLNASYTINENDINSSGSSNDLLETPHITSTENKPTESENTEFTVTNGHHQYQSMVDRNNMTQNSSELDMNISGKAQTDTNVITKEVDNKMIELEKEDSLHVIKMPVNEGNDMKIPRPPSVRPLSVRPSSSRPGAPRMREKVDNISKDTDNLLIAKVNIIVENTQNEEEEDSSLVIIDQGDTTAVAQDQQDLKLSSNEHGHLVQQILDSQKELSQISGKTEIEWQFGAQKAREAMNQDVEQLRFNIQALSRVANPLGKLLDHVQEDVEVMRQELQQWTNIYEEVNQEMLKQKTLNEDSLMPFHTKLKQLEGDIKEKHDKITDVKILIHKNASRIEKLLTSGNVQ